MRIDFMTDRNETATDPIMIGQREASRVLGMSERTISKMIGDDEIPTLKIGGRRLFSVEALKAWIAAKVAAAAEIEAAESEVPHVE
jgi:excisionase family DNA binding protein